MPPRCVGWWMWRVWGQIGGPWGGDRALTLVRPVGTCGGRGGVGAGGVTGLRWGPPSPSLGTPVGAGGCTPKWVPLRGVGNWGERMKNGGGGDTHRRAGRGPGPPAAAGHAAWRGAGGAGCHRPGLKYPPGTGPPGEGWRGHPRAVGTARGGHAVGLGARGLGGWGGRLGGCGVGGLRGMWVLGGLRGLWVLWDGGLGWGGELGEGCGGCGVGDVGGAEGFGGVLWVLWGGGA